MVETARHVVDALKRNPTCLAAIVVVAIFAALGYFRDERRSALEQARLVEISKMFQSCMEAQ